MKEPALEDIAKAICCPKKADREACEAAGQCIAEDMHFAEATAVRSLYRDVRRRK